MFVRASTLVLAIVASVIAVPDGDTSSECDTSDLQCCNSTQSADSIPQEILGLLGLGDIPVGSQIALGCTPITVIGTGSGADCSQQPVCCSNNNAGGLIDIYCTPINLDL